MLCSRFSRRRRKDGSAVAPRVQAANGAAIASSVENVTNATVATARVAADELEYLHDKLNFPNTARAKFNVVASNRGVARFAGDHPFHIT